MNTLASVAALLLAVIGVGCAATHTYWATALAMAGVALIQSVRLLKIKREEE